MLCDLDSSSYWVPAAFYQILMLFATGNPLSIDALTVLMSIDTGVSLSVGLWHGSLLRVSLELVNEA